MKQKGMKFLLVVLGCFIFQAGVCSLVSAQEDTYELANGLDPLDATGDNGADGDLDMDGFSNIDEMNAGTDPNDDTSFPATAEHDYDGDARDSL